MIGIYLVIVSCFLVIAPSGAPVDNSLLTFPPFPGNIINCQLKGKIIHKTRQKKRVKTNSRRYKNRLNTNSQI